MFTMVLSIFGVFASVLDACFKCFINFKTYVASVASRCFKSRSSVASSSSPSTTSSRCLLLLPTPVRHPNQRRRRAPAPFFFPMLVMLKTTWGVRNRVHTQPCGPVERALALLPARFIQLLQPSQTGNWFRFQHGILLILRSRPPVRFTGEFVRESLFVYMRVPSSALQASSFPSDLRYQRRRWLLRFWAFQPEYFWQLF